MNSRLITNTNSLSWSLCLLLAITIVNMTSCVLNSCSSSAISIWNFHFIAYGIYKDTPDMLFIQVMYESCMQLQVQISACTYRCSTASVVTSDPWFYYFVTSIIDCFHSCYTVYIWQMMHVHHFCIHTFFARPLFKHTEVRMYT